MQHDPHHHLIVRTSNGYTIVGLAHVQAAPYRRVQDAHAIARRIAAQPKAYLAVARLVNLPGIVDTRYGPGATLALAG
jgi:hypothetical protein